MSWISDAAVLQSKEDNWAYLVNSCYSFYRDTLGSGDNYLIGICNSDRAISILKTFLPLHAWSAFYKFYFKAIMRKEL